MLKLKIAFLPSDWPCQISLVPQKSFEDKLAENFFKAQGYYLPGSKVCTTCEGFGEHDSGYHDDVKVVKCIDCGGSGRKV